MPEKASELHEMLIAWLKEVDAQMPSASPASADESENDLLVRMTLEEELW